MPSLGRVVAAVFKREFATYFRSPTGYVFITLFVFLSAVAAFWQEGFFLNNLANLDQLNNYFPYLLVFLAPALTMGLWAEERKQGTEELLLTLPASDAALVLGKYFAALAIYTVALVFSLSHVAVLTFLGSPDLGLLASTYLGYWLMGAALLALGMLASQVTGNLTVAFILGAILCAIPVFLRHAGALLSGRAQRFAEQLSVVDQFRDLSQGIVTASAVVYFLAIAVTMLYLSVLAVGRGRWRTGRGAPFMSGHVIVRTVAMVAIVAAVTVLAGRLGGRIDITSEKIHSLAPETAGLIQNLDPERPVFIRAYLSPEVPRSYLEVRRNLSSFLNEFGAVGRDRVFSRIIETVKYSPEAREARELYGIEPYQVPPTEETASAINDIFLGLVFTCGTEEFVIPFFERGLPVEYELMRSIRVVSHSKRRKVGILNTGAQLFGEFDFQTKRQTQDWSIIPELRKQYEVVKVPAESDYPEDLDVLIGVLPNTLSTRELSRFTHYIETGKPVLAVLDPLPSFNLDLAPAAARVQPNPFQQQAPPKPPVDLGPLIEALGIEWADDEIAWDNYNPHPQFRQLPNQVLFISPGSGEGNSFQESEEMTSGLQEVVMLYAGIIKAAEGTEFVPLMSTGNDSGRVRWDQLVVRTMFGTRLAQSRDLEADDDVHAVAARVTRSGEKPLNGVVVMDVDMMGEQFFELRRRGIENLNFDNVTFILNAVDDLAGDDAFIALRKRRPKHRTLEAVEARTRVYEENRKKETEEAQARAETQLSEAQARLDGAVEAIRRRPDLDDQTREIMISNLTRSLERQLQVSRANIEDRRDQQIEDARISMEASVNQIRNTIKLVAVGLPPIPALIILIILTLRKIRVERMRISSDRLVDRRAA
jgi:gliding motility-associated transport system permease protein/gliding motility-associatede transport system auxiliary component